MKSSPSAAAARFAAYLTASLLAIAVHSAAASPRSVVPPRSMQPVGTPHKASSFVPRPLTTRVFGDPIQAPILKNVVPNKTPPG